MKPDDIKVGKYYRNHFFSPDYRFMGCGMRIMWEGKLNTTDARFKNKQLVIVECDDPTCIGMFFQHPEDSHNGLWDGFVEE